MHKIIKGKNKTQYEMRQVSINNRKIYTRITSIKNLNHKNENYPVSLKTSSVSFKTQTDA